MNWKKEISILGLVAAIILIFGGCKIGFDCELVDEYPEFENQEMLTDARLELLLIENPETFFGENLDTLEFIIDDAATYDAWKALADTTCFACNFPEIDFNTRTLIGKYQRLTCAEIPVVRIIKEGNTYKHLLKKVDNTRCLSTSCQNFTIGWATIPKLDATENVVFESGKSYYECDDC